MRVCVTVWYSLFYSFGMREILRAWILYFFFLNDFFESCFYILPRYESFAPNSYVILLHLHILLLSIAQLTIWGRDLYTHAFRSDALGPFFYSFIFELPCLFWEIDWRDIQEEFFFPYREFDRACRWPSESKGSHGIGINSSYMILK